MGPVYPRVLREWGYAAEIDALLAANVDASAPVLPATAERLARDVLVYGTFEDAVSAVARRQGHADAVALTLPFDVAPHELTASVEAVAPVHELREDQVDVGTPLAPLVGPRSGKLSEQVGELLRTIRGDHVVRRDLPEAPCCRAARP